MNVSGRIPLFNILEDSNFWTCFSTQTSNQRPFVRFIGTKVLILGGFIRRRRSRSNLCVLVRNLGGFKKSPRARLLIGWYFWPDHAIDNVSSFCSAVKMDITDLGWTLLSCSFWWVDFIKEIWADMPVSATFTVHPLTPILRDTTTLKVGDCWPNKLTGRLHSTVV